MMNNDFIWTQASTPIDVRWRRLYGWIPPSETPEGQEKFRKFKEMTIREITDIAVEQTKKTMTKLKERKNA